MGTHTLIFLRTHSAAVKAEPNYVCIFTSEPFNETEYYNEWTDGRLGKARFFTNETDYYFAITPRFIQYSMKGTFQNTTIIIMGCDGLTYINMAEAFTKKGAKVYISWDGPVSTSHTDKGTANLLKHLITENQTVTHAIAATMQEIGPDSTYGASLQFHPTTAGTHILNTEWRKPPESYLVTRHRSIGHLSVWKLTARNHSQKKTERNFIKKAKVEASSFWDDGWPSETRFPLFCYTLRLLHYM